MTGVLSPERMTGSIDMTSKKDFFSQLCDILEIEGDGFRKGYMMRKRALQELMADMYEEVETRELIINKNYMKAEHQDTIIYKLAGELAEELVDKGYVEIVREENRITAKIKAVK